MPGLSGPAPSSTATSELSYSVRCIVHLGGLHVDLASWIVLILALSAVAGTWATAVIASRRAQQQPPPPSEGEIAFRPDAEPRGQWDTRVGHVRDLMANQDTFTWAIVAISFAVQGGLFGIYFQGADPSGHLALPLAGLAAAFVFLLFVARSNWYMTTYMRLLRGTHREEYQIRAPHFPWSATSVMYGAHSVLALTWLVLLVSYLCACP